MSLAIIIKDIITVDDKQFAFAKFGEFDIVINKTDGYINLTGLCKSGNKDLKHWNELKHSRELLSLYEGQNSDLPTYQVTKAYASGTIREIFNKIIGTYGHPEIAIAVSQWISPAYQLHVSKIVINYYLTRSSNEMACISDELSHAMKQLSIKDTLLEEKDHKIRRLKTRYSPKPLDPKLEASYIFVHKDIDPEVEEVIRRGTLNEDSLYKIKPIIVSNHQYYIVRIQQKSRLEALNKLRKRYTNMIILHEWPQSSNSINIGNVMKDNFRNHKDFNYSYNHIRLGDVSCQDVINAISTILEFDLTDEEIILEDEFEDL